MCDQHSPIYVRPMNGLAQFIRVFAFYQVSNCAAFEMNHQYYGPSNIIRKQATEYKVFT